MRIAILSDIHANLAALEAVLADLAKRGGCDALYHAGDIAGYGPDINECAAMLRGAGCVGGVLGNHDAAMFDDSILIAFNFSAATAATMTRQWAEPETLDMLRALPITVETGEPDMMIVHSSPSEPQSWRYVQSQMDMIRALRASQRRITVVGHTHFPFITEVSEDKTMVLHGSGPGRVILKPESRLLINPGSVGQPRDHDPRAAYLLMDADYAEIVRVEYDIDRTLARMTERDLPLPLRERLKYGF